MNNLFKQNSRFAALSEDCFETPKKDKKSLKQNSNIKSDNKEESINTFKNDTRDSNSFHYLNGRERDSGFRRYNYIESDKSKQERLLRENNRKLKEKQEKERLEQESLKLDNFPSLENNKKEIKIKQTEQDSYLEKLKQSNNNNNDNDNDNDNNKDQHLVDLKPGWVSLNRDPKTGNTIIKSHPCTLLTEKSELEIGRDILKALTDLHEKRTKDYIENYGEYTWEKMFKQPRWREEETENMSESDDFDEEDENEEEYEEEYGY